ncbi:DUF488 domain-containing protein [Nostoc sp.]|uniref:DUF488 domain-containing protein n=1 Tax=Nostoc sp. TaxID=1180 RepID=UPI002FF68481
MGIIYTIGFTKKSAQDFFELLKGEKINLVADVRLNNTGQLAGFTKKKDLEYFLSLIEVKYEHWTNFAPTKELRDKYHTTREWEEYECSYRSLIKSRKALKHLNKTLLKNQRICLLCSEHTPEKCHRRIASEMLADMIDGMEIVHL